jgi:hypothetical protein
MCLRIEGDGRMAEELVLLLVLVSAIKPYEGFGDVNHTIKDLMSF